MKKEEKKIAIIEQTVASKLPNGQIEEKKLRTILNPVESRHALEKAGILPKASLQELSEYNYYNGIGGSALLPAQVAVASRINKNSQNTKVGALAGLMGFDKNFQLNELSSFELDGVWDILKKGGKVAGSKLLNLVKGIHGAMQKADNLIDTANKYIPKAQKYAKDAAHASSDFYKRMKSQGTYSEYGDAEQTESNSPVMPKLMREAIKNEFNKVDKLLDQDPRYSRVDQYSGRSMKDDLKQVIVDQLDKAGATTDEMIKSLKSTIKLLQLNGSESTDLGFLPAGLLAPLLIALLTGAAEGVTHSFFGDSEHSETNNGANAQFGYMNFINPTASGIVNMVANSMAARRGIGLDYLGERMGSLGELSEIMQNNGEFGILPLIPIIGGLLAALGAAKGVDELLIRGPERRNRREIARILASNPNAGTLLNHLTSQSLNGYTEFGDVTDRTINTVNRFGGNSMYKLLNKVSSNSLLNSGDVEDMLAGAEIAALGDLGFDSWEPSFGQHEVAAQLAATKDMQHGRGTYQFPKLMGILGGAENKSKQAADMQALMISKERGLNYSDSQLGELSAVIEKTWDDLQQAISTMPKPIQAAANSVAQQLYRDSSNQVKQSASEVKSLKEKLQRIEEYRSRLQRENDILKKEMMNQKNVITDTQRRFAEQKIEKQRQKTDKAIENITRDYEQKLQQLREELARLKQVEQIASDEHSRAINIERRRVNTVRQMDATTLPPWRSSADYTDLDYDVNNQPGVEREILADGTEEIRYPNGTIVRLRPDGVREIIGRDGTARPMPARRYDRRYPRYNENEQDEEPKNNKLLSSKLIELTPEEYKKMIEDEQEYKNLAERAETQFKAAVAQRQTMASALAQIKKEQIMLKNELEKANKQLEAYRIKALTDSKEKEYQRQSEEYKNRLSSQLQQLQRLESDNLEKIKAYTKDTMNQMRREMHAGAIEQQYALFNKLIQTMKEARKISEVNELMSIMPDWVNNFKQVLAVTQPTPPQVTFNPNIEIPTITMPEYPDIKLPDTKFLLTMPNFSLKPSDMNLNISPQDIEVVAKPMDLKVIAPEGWDVEKKEPNQQNKQTVVEIPKDGEVIV